MLLQDQAICIRHVKYSESSQVITLFGRAYGRLRAIAKGSRRPRGKFGGGVDLLTAGEIMFLPPGGEGGLATLTEFELTEAFAGLRQNLLALNCAQYAADLVNEFTEDLDPHPQLYDGFAALLRNLQGSGTPAAHLVLFEMILLREAGLVPDFFQCCLCSRPVPDKGMLYFSSASGGIVCRDCEPAVIEKRQVPAAVAYLLRRPELALTAEPPAVLAAHELLSYHQRELLGKETTVMNFVNKLLRGRPNGR